MVLIHPDVDVTSVVVTFKNCVVGGGVVVESPGVVALNPFVFSLARSGAAKEEERGRRSRVSIIIVLSFGLFLYFELKRSCSFRRWRSSAFVLSSGRVIYPGRQDLPEEWTIKLADNNGSLSTESEIRSK